MMIVRLMIFMLRHWRNWLKACIFVFAHVNIPLLYAYGKVSALVLQVKYLGCFGHRVKEFTKLNTFCRCNKYIWIVYMCLDS